MVDFERMTPEEMKEYLLKSQEKAKSRQRAYVQRKQKAGGRRVNNFISAQASDALDDLMSWTGKGVGDVMSDALLFYAKHHALNPDAAATPARISRPARPGQAPRNSRRTSPEKEARIVELNDQGLGPQAIATQLNDEGIQTAGGGLWERGSVARIIKRHRGGE